MRFSSGFRAALAALFTLAGAGVSSAAYADGGIIWIEELKGGWFIGGSGGSGTLIFHGRRYPLKIGGLSAGLVFGGSVTRLYGYVSNIRYPSDVAGVYGGAGAGAALVVGARAIILRNEKGAVLRLSGQQFGLIAKVIGRCSSGCIGVFPISATPRRSCVLRQSFAGTGWVFAPGGAGNLTIQAAGPELIKNPEI